MNFVVWAALALAGSMGAQVSSVPAGVRSALDRMHPGWRIAEVSRAVRAAVADRLGPVPNVILGDFDGNGRQDVAVLIEYRNVAEPEKAFTHYAEIIAFLDTGRGYEAIRVDDRVPGPDPDRYLTLQKRGARGFDFEANTRFTYPHDSIGAWFFEKAGGTYIYDKGSFRFVLEED